MIVRNRRQILVEDRRAGLTTINFEALRRHGGSALHGKSKGQERDGKSRVLRDEHHGLDVELEDPSGGVKSSSFLYA
jgi:hypothetical protein